MRFVSAMLLVAGCVLVLSGGHANGASTDMPGVKNSGQAHIDYILKCQGCHRPDGGGDKLSNPPLGGVVARFLSVAGGREYLGRVPGVATTDLNDERLADLLNWTLYRFDRANMPIEFKPYGASEIGSLRQSPLRVDASKTRALLVGKMAGGPL